MMGNRNARTVTDLLNLNMEFLASNISHETIVHPWSVHEIWSFDQLVGNDSIAVPFYPITGCGIVIARETAGYVANNFRPTFTQFFGVYARLVWVTIVAVINVQLNARVTFPSFAVFHLRHVCEVFLQVPTTFWIAPSDGHRN